MKTAVIIRGVAGSTKSTFALYLTADYSNLICCADDFFTDKSGKYNFDSSKLGAAHAACKAKFEAGLEQGVDLVVCNTSTRRADRNWYANKALEKGYRVFSIVMENFQGTKSIHNVPEMTLDKMRKELKENIDL